MESTQRNILIGSGLIGFILGLYINGKDKTNVGAAGVLIVIAGVFLYGAYVIAKQNPKNYYFLVAVMSLIASIILGMAAGGLFASGK